MAVAIAILSFLALASAIVWYGYRVYAKPGRVFDELKPAAPSAADNTGPQANQTGVVRVIRQIGEKVPASPADIGLARRYLMGAGFRSEGAVQVYYGLKVICCLAMVVFVLVTRVNHVSLPILRILIPAGFAAFGWFGPGLVLESLVRRRQERLQLSLPDALDLMVVCVEAGHGLDQAFTRVSKELMLTHKDICEEFALVTLEMKAGKRRADALHNLAERTGEAELRKLVAVLIQADRFGTGIAESLRVHADFMRISRRQRAEERANKVGVKLVFPIFFCILPTMFIVCAGPGMLQLITGLLPLLKEMQR